MIKALTKSLLVTSLLLAMILTTACGWHLRGITPLPDSLKTLMMSSKASSTFNERLTQQLEFNGSQIVSSQDGTVSLLSIGQIKTERRTLTVNSLGQAAEYELEASLEVQLITEQQDYNWQLNVRRTFSNDVNNVVATANEQKIQLLEIEQQLTNQLMRRLQKTQ